MSVFLHFDYGQNAELFEGKRGICSCPVQYWHAPETDSSSTSLQWEYNGENHPKEPTEQVPPWSPTNRTSPSDDGQERRIPEGHRAETTSCDSQDSSNRMATSIEPCGLRFHSLEEVRSDVRNSTKTKWTTSILMFWGCIRFGRAGHLVEVQGSMDRQNYINIIQQHLQPSASDILAIRI